MPVPTVRMPIVRDDVVLFQGGLDSTTPILKLRPGHVKSAHNWQAVTNVEGGGYERVGGYDRFTGQTLPSAQSYTIMQIRSWILKPSLWTSSTLDLAGVKLHGATTGPLATLPVDPGPTPWPMIGGGTYRQRRSFAVEEASDPLWVGFPYLIVPTTITAVFQAGETLRASYFDIAGNESAQWDVAVIDVGAGAAVPLGIAITKIIAPTVADGARSGLAPPSGSGAVLGVVSLVSGGVRTVYAWRNTVAGTAAAIHKSTAFGWVSVPLYSEVRFTAGGTAAPAEGATLTKGAVTAVMKRVVRESGTWSAGTAAGRFIITTPTGGNFSAGTATIGAITVTLSGAQSAIALAPGGRYEFDVANFGGQLTSRRIYGADGLNRAFEFDGDVLVPIETKAAQDTPKFVRRHHHHLVLAIGSSLMVSGPGLPYVFDPVEGAIELATGDDVAGLLVQPGTQDTAALAVFGRNSSGMLYGTSAADFIYKAFATMTGALPYMTVNLDQSYVMDDRGVMSLAAAQEYGNFKQATLTANIAKFVTDRKPLASCACVNMERSQVRLFFTDGSALYLTIVNGRLIGAMPQQFQQSFRCVWNAEDASGIEETFAGGLDGQVYKLDVGASFDGAPISHFLIFTPNFMGTPSTNKIFRNGYLEINAERYAEFEVGYALRYDSASVFQPVSSLFDNSGRIVQTWDAFIWDNFVWDGATQGPIEIEIKGKSEVIQMIVSGSSDYVHPFRLSSLHTHYSLLRRTRS